MFDDEKIKNINQDIDSEKLIKSYVDTVFHIWRMGKVAKLNYEINKKKVQDIDEKLDNFKDFLLNVNQLFSNVNNEKKLDWELKFDDTFDLEDYIQGIEYHRKSLEKTLLPLKNLSKKYDRILKILRKNGFQIIDFDGKKFNEGMSIKVLEYDSKAGVEEDIILETIKPTIFFNNKEYLKGEVIVSE